VQATVMAGIKFSKDREDVVGYLRSQLIGPAVGDEEELPTGGTPVERYLMGKLYPQDADTGQILEEQEEEGSGETPAFDKDEWTDSPISLAFQRLPASMGLSFYLSAGGKISVTLKGATYEKVQSRNIILEVKTGGLPRQTIEKLIETLVTGLGGIEGIGSVSLINKDETAVQLKFALQEGADAKALLILLSEKAEELAPKELELTEPEIRQERQIWRRYNLAEKGGETVQLSEDSRVIQGVLDGRAEISSHWRPMKGGHLVTVSIFNNRRAKENSALKPQDCLFQTGFEISPLGASIKPYPRRYGRSLGEEEEELDLLYRDNVSYAVGHGCSVSWKLDGAKTVRSINTEFMPQKEVPDITTNIDGLDGAVLQLQTLANESIDPADLIRLLKNFLDSYAQWIGGLEQENTDIPAQLSKAKKRILSRLDEALKRMHSGAKLLASDPMARKAFALANHAMLMQMVHSNNKYSGPHSRGEANTTTPDYFSDEYRGIRWRPFQLAFQLLVVESMLNGKSPNRDLVDLIWFPTGGGKTEAYLGVAAMEIFHRRLKHGSKGGGTVVLKRYTLRLLTNQQFQRAARLICACELIRQQNSSLGEEPITLGLWVGQKSTPNTFTSNNNNPGALEAHREQLQSDRPLNPFALMACPWCGTVIYPLKQDPDRSSYGVETTETSFKFFCPDGNCAFHKILPVNVVDEHFFEHPFDTNNRTQAGPPTFVVGTIDKLARTAWDPRSRSIFGFREKGENFMPPSLVIQDELHLISGPLGTIAGVYESAFDVMMSGETRPKIIAATATIRRADDQVQQLYGRGVRIFPPSGLRAADSYYSRHVPASESPGRLYLGCMGQGATPLFSLVQLCSALSQVQKERELKPEAADGYWTQVIFHNSRRELGKTMTLSRDDIPGRIKVIGSDQSRLRDPDEVVELSANLAGYEIPKVLDQLNISKGEKGAIDILACTNMFSVGVDISRLGLMVINGQPKTTAEYIQASSRVGRDLIPGLVVTHYSSTKPRDRSHYETFVSYHDALYRAVEPTSVTPFALPALDRALHAALISLMRIAGGLIEDGDCKDFDIHNDHHSQLVDKFRKRIESAAKDRDRKQSIEKLNTIIDEWREKINQAGGPLRFEAKAGKQFRALMCRYEKKKQGAWPTLNSMRNVDLECRIEVKGENLSRQNAD
jgi:hypothetical protein